MSNPNVATAIRWFEEVWNQRKTDIMEEVLTGESCCHSELGFLKGAENFKNLAHSPLLTAFPDLHIKVEAAIGDGDHVVVRWISTGTHTGEGMGMPPSGRKISFRGMTWIRFENGKMVEGWDCWNHVGILEGLRSPTLPLPDNFPVGHLRVAAPGASLD